MTTFISIILEWLPKATLEELLIITNKIAEISIVNTEELRKVYNTDGYISAIKYVRRESSLDLKESKLYVDKILNRLT